MDELKKYSKKELYENYERLVVNPKEYEKITREKMVHEIIDMYKQDYSIIYDLCIMEELDYLKKVLNNEKEIYLDIYNKVRKSLKEKCLIIELLGTVKVIRELEETITLVIYNINYKTMKKVEEINSLVIGYMKVKGISSSIELKEFNKNILKLSDKDFKAYLTNSAMFRYYVSCLGEQDNGNETTSVFVYREYDAFLEEIIFNLMNLSSPGELTYSKKTLKNMFYYDFNINDRLVKKCINLLKESYVYSYIFAKIKECVILDLDREDLFEELKKYCEVDNKFIKIMNSAMDRMPSPSFCGLSKSMIK